MSDEKLSSSPPSLPMPKTTKRQRAPVGGERLAVTRGQLGAHARDGGVERDVGEVRQLARRPRRACPSRARARRAADTRDCDSARSPAASSLPSRMCASSARIVAASFSRAGTDRAPRRTGARGSRISGAVRVRRSAHVSATAGPRHRRRDAATAAPRRPRRRSATMRVRRSARDRARARRTAAMSCVALDRQRRPESTKPASS